MQILPFTVCGVDTETTGLYDFKAPATADHQPRIVQIAAAIMSREGKIISRFSTLIKPCRIFPWKLEAKAAEIHGITLDMCEEFGIPLSNAIAIVKNMMDVTEVAVAHNWDYDSALIRRELAVLGKEDFISRKRSFCTMKSLASVLKIPGPRGFKWPRLQEAHKHFIGHEFDAAHDALADIEATLRVLSQGIAVKHPEILRVA